MSATDEQILWKHDALTEPALRYIMEQNGVSFIHRRGGRYFIDKPKRGKKNEYDTISVPEAKLDMLRTRFSRGEPPQDFEGIIYPPKKQRQQARKRGRK